VPLPEFLLSYLARQCEGRERDDLLFPGEDGRYLKRPHPTPGWFIKAVAESGIPRTTPHDLRHTAASLAVSAGANVKAVQKMLGHASSTPTYLTTIWKPSLLPCTTLVVGKVWAKCGHGVESRPTDRPPDPRELSRRFGC